MLITQGISSQGLLRYLNMNEKTLGQRIRERRKQVGLSQNGLSKAAGVDPSAVSQWQELVPEGRAMRLQEASGGELLYDPKVYDEYRKTKRAGRLNNENHS